MTEEKKYMIVLGYEDPEVYPKLFASELEAENALFKLWKKDKIDKIALFRADIVKIKKSYETHTEYVLESED